MVLRLIQPLEEKVIKVDKEISLKELSEKVIEKQTHKRNALQKVLDKWCEETSDGISNLIFERCKICEDCGEPNSYIYFLQRDYSKVYKIWDEDWNNDNFDCEEEICIPDEDMYIIDDIIANINQGIEKYKEKLREEIK